MLLLHKFNDTYTHAQDVRMEELLVTVAFEGADGNSTLYSISVGGVVLCGVVLCGVVLCGVVWWGVVGCGVVWCGVVWCGVVGWGVVWFVVGLP